MKKFFILMLVFLFQIKSSANSEAQIIHQFKKNESIWFLAKLYYGDSNRYQKIIKNNSSLDLKNIKLNQLIKIKNPKFNPETKDFSARYQTLMNQKLSSITGISETKTATQYLNENILKKYKDQRLQNKSLKKSAEDELNSL